MNPSRICLWRYREHPRDYAGFHLSAEKTGCAQLLGLLANLAKARTPQIASIVLDPPTAAVLSVANAHAGNSPVIAFRHWELLVDPGFPPERLHFTVIMDRVRTELSPVQVESMAAGVEDMIAYRGGYPIGDEEEDQLWFWWQDRV
jgi:hypothetical protein